MTTNPSEAPPEPADDAAGGPRVGRDEIRDLARLRRSAHDRKVAGVGGGIARHLDVDPIIPRVLLVVLVFFGGAGILIYATVWLVVPVEGSDDATVRLDDRSRTGALLVVGVLAALALVGDSIGGWGFPWPVVLLGVVVLLVLMARGTGPRVHPALRQGSYAATSGHPYAQPHAQPEAQPDERREPLLFPYALALVALGIGALGLADAAGADVAHSAYPAIALGTCAALLVLGAFWGRAGGLILLGLVSAVATAGATAAGEVDAGHVEATPATAASVQDRYDLAFGEIELDLTEVADPVALDGRTVEVELDVAGRISVVVPDDLDVVVRSSIDAGERQVFGDRLGDGDDVTTTVDGGPGAPELTLDVSTSFGEIVITREDTGR